MKVTLLLHRMGIVMDDTSDDTEAPFVDGFTREQSREVAKRALRNFARELGKRQARADFEIAVGIVKRTRKTILKPAGGISGWRRKALKTV